MERKRFKTRCFVLGGLLSKTKERKQCAVAAQKEIPSSDTLFNNFH